MQGREPGEHGRAVTQLELFLDLVLVVAVALAAGRLHHAYLDGFRPEMLLAYLMVFLGVWPAWSHSRSGCASVGLFDSL